jgi:NADH-quinone oxidoreductase subunit D
MGSVLTQAIGHNLADVPMILVGIDPCFSCNDRAVILRENGRGSETWSWADLRRYGIDYYKRRMASIGN